MHVDSESRASGKNSDGEVDPKTVTKDISPSPSNDSLPFSPISSFSQDSQVGATQFDLPLSSSPVLSFGNDDSTLVPTSQASSIVGSSPPASQSSTLVASNRFSPASDISKETVPVVARSDDENSTGASDTSAGASDISGCASPSSDASSNVPRDSVSAADSSSATASSSPCPPSSRYSTRSQVPAALSKEALTCFHVGGGNYLISALEGHGGKEMVELFRKWNDTFKELKGMKKVRRILLIRSSYLFHH